MTKASYRYNPVQTNFTGIGLYRGGAALTFDRSTVEPLNRLDGVSTTNIFHFPLSTLHLSFIGDLGDGSGDTDNDGLTDWEEVKRYHTDPREADTDGDGLADGYEVRNGTDPKYYLEVEAGRETASGWQHLAWIDTDPETPGIQRRTAISRDNPPAIDWDTKATSSAPLYNGIDSLVYDSKTTFTRALPAVASGQYVPPPFVTVISRTFDDKNNLVSEFSTTQSIQQYVQITWTTNTVEEFRQPITYSHPGEGALPPTNVTMFAGCSVAEAEAAFAGIATNVQAIFPANANIIVVGPTVNVPQPHKTVEINSGALYNPATGTYRDVLGSTPTNSCFPRNESPEGTAGVYMESVRSSFLRQYDMFYDPPLGTIPYKFDWRGVPLPLNPAHLSLYVSQIALHECCHSMGLVPAASSNYNDHNDCRIGEHYMDSGQWRTILMHLGFLQPLALRWKPENIQYLEFVFSSPHEE